MKGYKERIFKGFAINIIMAFSIAVLGYLTRIILAKNLSLKEYGLFYAVFSFVSFFNLFRDLGIGVTSIRAISAGLARGDRKDVKTTILSALFFQTSIIAVIAIMLIIFSGYLSVNFFKENATLVIIFIALSYLFSISQDVTSSIASGFQSMFFAGISEFLRHTLIVIVLLFGLSFNKTAVLPAFAYFIVMLILPFLHVRILLWLMPDFFTIKAGKKINKLKNMLRFAFPVLLSSIGGMMIAYSDTIMLTYFKTLEDVGLYNVAIPISMIIWYFGNSIAAIMLPVISEMWQKKQKAYVKEGISLLHKYSFAAIVPIALGFIAFPEEIIKLLFGDKYLGAKTALQILSFGAIMYNVAIINSNILVGIGKPQINSKIMLFGASFNIISNLIMIPRFGILGAAITTATSYTIIFLLNTFNVRKITKSHLPLMQYAKIMVGGAVFLGIIKLLKGTMPLNLYFEAIIVLAIASLGYLGYLLIVRVVSMTELKDLSSRVLKIRF